MKKSLYVFVLFVASVCSSAAQISEGHVSYDVTVNSDDPEMAMMNSLMANSKMDIYFKKEKSRADMQMGSMGSTSTIIDPTAENSLILMDLMGMKSATLLPKSELNKPDEGPKSKLKLVNETKTILGYKCKKALLTDESGNTVSYWYTEEINVNLSGQRAINKEVPGFPLEFTMIQSGITMKLTATVFEKTVDSKLFDLTVPDDYTIQSWEDIQELGQ